jgi:hypothetical protein
MEACNRYLLCFLARPANRLSFPLGKGLVLESYDIPSRGLRLPCFCSVLCPNYCVYVILLSLRPIPSLCPITIRLSDNRLFVCLPCL